MKDRQTRIGTNSNDFSLEKAILLNKYGFEVALGSLQNHLKTSVTSLRSLYLHKIESIYLSRNTASQTSVSFRIGSAKF